MQRKLWFVVVVGALTIAAGGVGSLWWASLQPPEFYRAAEKQVLDPVVRKDAAQKFEQQTKHLVEEIKQSGEWSEEFTDAQINAWLTDEFPTQFAEWIPTGVSGLRIRVTPQAVMVGFRYVEADQWSGVVSLSARTWVDAPNRLAIQLQTIQAGLLPIPIDTIIQQVVEHAKDSGAEIEWRDHSEGKIAIVTLAPVGDGAPQLENVALSKGRLRVSGSSKPANGSFQFEPMKVATQDSAAARGRQ